VSSFPIQLETAYPFPQGAPSSIPGFSIVGRFLTPGTPPNGGPDLQTRWDLGSVYIPMGVEVNGGTPLPSVCDLTLQMVVSSHLVWQQQQQIPLRASAAGSAVIGTGTFADSMPNPIPFHNGQTFALAYIVVFDQPIIESGGISFAALVLAGNWTQAGLVPTPGDIGYTEVFKPWTMPAPRVAA